MLFANGVQITGVAFFGYILSNVASILARADAAREHHMDSVDKMETFMRSHQIPQDLKSKVRSYYHYLWKTKKGYQDQTLLSDLPGKINAELIFHINRSIIEKVPFLKEESRELIEDLMNELRSRIYVPGERIFRIDEPGDALYLIYHGQIDILTKDNQILATLGEGAFFGEMALISDNPRSATARAASYSDVYVLPKEAFIKVTQAYPEFREHIEKVVEARKAS